MVFFLMFFSQLYCQNQTLADSLESIYLLNKYPKQEKLKVLKSLAVNHHDTEKKLKFSEELIVTAEALDSIDHLFQGYLEKGNALRLKSDHIKALESYFEGAKIASENKLNRRLGTVNIAIADVYSIIGNHNNASNYYQIAIEILREEKDSVNVASALLNAGDEYFNYGLLDSALIFFRESGEIFKALNSRIGVAYNLGNVGLVFAELQDNQMAEKNINEAIEILTELGDYYPISVYLTYMSDIYLKKGDTSRALNYSNRSLELAQKYGLKEQISDANLQLSELYEHVGNIEKSFKFYKNHITIRDSVSNIEMVREMADLRTAYEVSQKQLEVDLLNQQKRNQRIIVIAVIIALFLSSLLAFGLYRRYLFIKKTKQIIEVEKNRSDSLLLNILPEETAKELKEFGTVKANRFESVSVLFTDFKGFTNFSENLSPEKLVESVDYYFSKFDAIIEKYDLEKIKTIGDAYMCAGGLPYPTKDHAHKMVSAAIEIVKFVEDYKSKNSKNETRFDIRVGINTGPVVAGVVGLRKFAYDIWGDTVNIAARMESSSIAGKINISENTYDLIKDDFECEYRGEIDVKNKGKLKMYFVKA